MNIVKFKGKEYEISFGESIGVSPKNDIIESIANSDTFNDYTFEQDENTFTKVLQDELSIIEKMGHGAFYH